MKICAHCKKEIKNTINTDNGFNYCVMCYPVNKKI